MMYKITFLATMAMTTLGSASDQGHGPNLARGQVPRSVGPDGHPMTGSVRRRLPVIRQKMRNRYIDPAKLNEFLKKFEDDEDWQKILEESPQEEPLCEATYAP